MIKHFNIMKDCSSCEYTGFKDLALDFLLRQASQKELDGRIIITIPPATSAGGQAMCLTQLIPFIAAEPRPLLRVVEIIPYFGVEPHYVGLAIDDVVTHTRSARSITTYCSKRLEATTAGLA